MMRNKSHILLLCLLVFGILLFIIYLYRSQTQPPITIETKNVIKKSTSIPSQLGSLNLLANQNKIIYAVDEPIQMILRANTNDPIIGFDAVIRYDPKKVLLMGLKTVDDQYQIVKTERSGEAIITGYLSSKKTSSTMKNNAILSLSFKAIKKGNTGILLFKEDVPSSKDSNLINSKGEDVLIHTFSDPVFIGEKAVLQLLKPYVFSGIDFTVLSIKKSEKNCTVCTTKMKLVVEKDSSTNSVTIAQNEKTGRIQDPISVVNTIFQMNTVSLEKANLYYLISE